MINATPTLAIVGGGASGLLVAIQVLRLAQRPVTVTVIDPASQPGRGIAYRKTSASHLLNVRASNMSALPDEPDHFLRLARELGAGDDIAGDSFISRSRYGDYLQALLAAAIEQAAPGVTLDWVQGTAVDLKPQSSVADVVLANGESIRAHQVVLALGNPPPADPLAGIADGPGRERVLDGYDWHTIKQRVEPHRPILLVGTGLTMVDALLTLRECGHTAPIHVVSRHGLLPLAHHPRQPYPQFLADQAVPASLSALMRRVRAEVRVAAAKGYAWQSVLDALRPITQQLWINLPDAERRRFLRHARANWNVHRHRIAPEIAAYIDKLQSDGRLIVHAGRLAAYTEDGEGATVVLRLRRTQELIRLRAGLIINCTGPTSAYTILQNQLLANLHTRGLLRPDSLNLGIDADQHGQLRDINGQQSSLLWTLGPPLKGILWECTSIPDIRLQALELASRLLGKHV